MGGIVILTGLALLAIFMIWLPFFVMRQAGKSPKLEKHKKTLGLASFLIVFGIFIGPEIYQYSKYRLICATQTMNEVYDRAAYEKFFKTMNNRKNVTIRGKELDELAKGIGIDRYEKYAELDKGNNYLYFAQRQNKGNTVLLYQEMVNLDTKKKIYRERNYSGAHGGWLCKLTDYTTGNCNYNSCKSNGFGAFSKGSGFTF